MFSKCKWDRSELDLARTDLGEFAIGVGAQWVVQLVGLSKKEWIKDAGMCVHSVSECRGHGRGGVCHSVGGVGDLVCDGKYILE